MKKWLITVGFLFLYSCLSAQQEPSLSAYKSRDEQIKVWYQYCIVLVDSAHYQTLITASQKGIRLCSGNHPSYFGKFCYFTGYGYEYADNTYDSAVRYYELAERFARISRDIHDETNALMRLNYMYYSTARFRKRDSLIQTIKNITDTTKIITRRLFSTAALASIT